MDRSLLKLIRSNIIFILCFSFIFSTYCLTASYIFDRAKCYSENTEADRTISERLIVIDPGHGGEDGGAVGINGVYEKELNLDISEALATYLRFAGFEVVQTRTEDVLLYDRNVNYKGRKKVLDLAARLNIAEELTKARTAMAV